MNNPPLRLAAMASGTGTNLGAILDNIKKGLLNCEMRLVLSNNSNAGALHIARAYGIVAIHLSKEQFPGQNEFDDRLLQLLQEYQVEMIVLAGYLKKLSSKVVRAYKHKILNIHPALLPSFGGKGMYGHRVHQAVLDYGCKVSGVTVHLIDDEYDSGPPIMQRCVPVQFDDTADTLAARILQEEHKIYSDVIQLFAERRVEIHGRKVIIK